MSTSRALVLMVGVIVLSVAASVHRGGALAAQTIRQQTAFDGSSMFKTYCATCHGVSAKGDGPFAAAMRRKPPDLTQLTKLNEGKFPAERVTKAIDGRDNKAAPHGPSDMPVWGDAFSRTTQDNDPDSVKQKIEALVMFVESIQERPATQQP